MLFFRRLGRFEILLPLKYNDGSPVEPMRFAMTREELDTIFGGSTRDSIPASGHWFYEGVLKDFIAIEDVKLQKDANTFHPQTMENNKAEEIRELRKRIGDRIGDRMGNRIGDRMGNKIENKISFPVLFPILFPVPFPVLFL